MAPTGERPGDLSLPFARAYRVRFDEAGADGRVRPGSLVRYLQDLAWLHSEAAGFDRTWYAERGLGWLVRGLTLTLENAATYGETLTVTTRIAGWRRMWAQRASEVLTPAGASIASGRIDWVLLDATGRPARIPPVMEAAVPPLGPFTPTRVDLPPPPPDADVALLAVRVADADPMGHLNNAAYLDLLAQAPGQDLAPGLPRTYRLEYLRPALPGMDLELTSWAAAPGQALRLRERGTSIDLLRATIA